MLTVEVVFLIKCDYLRLIFNQYVKSQKVTMQYRRF